MQLVLFYSAVDKAAVPPGDESRIGGFATSRAANKLNAVWGTSIQKPLYNQNSVHNKKRRDYENLLPRHKQYVRHYVQSGLTSPKTPLNQA